VDIGALLGLFLYLAGGVLTHYYVIYGIKKELSRYLLPYIAVYSVTDLNISNNNISKFRFFAPQSL